MAIAGGADSPWTSMGPRPVRELCAACPGPRKERELTYYVGDSSRILWMHRRVGLPRLWFDLLRYASAAASQDLCAINRQEAECRSTS